MIFKIKLIIFLSLILFLPNTYGQTTKLDSLLSNLKQTKIDSSRCNILLEIGDFYEYEQPDSALFYYNKVIDIARSKKLTKIEAITLRFMGIVEKRTGNYEIAIDYYKNALDKFAELGDISGIAKCYNNIGNVYFAIGNYDTSIDNFIKALKYFEQLNDKDGISACYMNIGLVHYEQRNFKSAIEFYNKSLALEKELNDKNGESACYTNIGSVYLSTESYDEALEYFLKAFDIVKQINDKRVMSACYMNIGQIYNKKGLYEKAIEFYEKALIIKEELKDKNGISMVYGNISILHLEMADASSNQIIRLTHLNSAIEYSNKGMTIAKEINATPLIYQFSFTLKNIYKAQGNNKKALEFAEIFIAVKDSLFSEEKTKSLAEMSAKYEAEKRDLAIQKLEKEKLLQSETIARKNAESKKQKILTYSFLIGFLIILIFSVFLYKLLMQKKKANAIIESKNASLEVAFIEINMQKEEITAQRDEIELHRDKLSSQNQILSIQKQEITDSIIYAKRIQDAVLPINEEYRSIMGDHFILFRPKDIVSGDFYWTAKIKNTLIVAVADCTGHGVPGAFMSMLGISFLNEIIRNKTITKANEVLNELRKEIINALQQKGQSGEQKDGMDISILAIDSNTNNAQWAGANNPLWIVKSPKPQNQNSKTQELETLPKSLDLGLEALFLELKGDKMPIAIFDKMDNFTNHEFEIQNGDLLYLMSDGYQDQFGGPKHKKFLSKNLKQLLLDNSQKTMDEQKEILESTLIEWIGDGDQIDDITLIGIKI